MAPTLEFLPLQFFTPDCEVCPGGVGIALTVVIWGKPDGRGADGLATYGEPGESDRRAFVAELRAAVEGEAGCCFRGLAVARIDPRRSARANAAALVGQLVAHALGLVNRPDVARVWFHLVGFSAGGQVALQMAGLLPDRLPKSISPALRWCGAPLAPLGTIPATTDVVTIATPLGSSGPRGWNVETVASEIAGFFSWIARLGAQLVRSDETFTLSINEDDYGGPRPAGLCRYVAVVTSSAYDRSWGAEESPAGDPYRLGAWAPDVVNLAVENGLPTRHTDAPRGALAQRRALFAAACECIPRPA